MVKSYTLAGTAALICLVLAVCAVISTIHILQDIGNFYNEAQEELVEFKDIANSVWDEMVFESSPEEMREAVELDREKRSYDDQNEYGAETTTPTTTTTKSTTTTSTATSVQYSSDESGGYDFVNDNGPPSSRPRKPAPPTMPRTIQGFRAPPPAATSTYRPPSNQNYDNYGREPASSRRPHQPQQHSTSAPYSTPNNRTFYNPKTPNSVYTPNSRVPYQPSNYTPSPNGNRAPYNPNFSTHAPNTPPPRQPTGGYDSDGKVPPNWPKVYNTRRPGGSYPEDQVPTAPPVPQQRVPPTQTRNPPNPPRDQPYPGRTNPPHRNPERPTPTPLSPTGEIPTGQTGSRPGFGPQRPRIPNRQRINPCDQCSAQPNNCPAGPPGPRGRPGPPGFPGQDGPRGLRGLNGGYSGVHPSSYDPVIGCVQCPVGPPGERGADGAPGAPGEDGIDGEQGVNGQDGQPGAPGAPGYHGINGIPGQPGKPGTPGRNGQACRSIPGPPGRPGAMGTPGRDGDPGTDGEHGQDGSPGIQGPPGADGRPGVDGPQGTSAPGAPGTDGGYCPCPKRSSKFDFSDVGYADDEKRPAARLPAHAENYEENSGYERQRRPNYEASPEVPPQRKSHYEEEAPPPRRQPPPQRQMPRQEQHRYPEEYDRRPQESQRTYESERPSDREAYSEERSAKTRHDEEHPSGYGGDERRPYSDRRPVEQPRYEPDRRPLKKVEINRNHHDQNQDRGYDRRQPVYEEQKPAPRYQEPYYEEPARKETHPPGFGRPKSSEEENRRTYPEDSMPEVKQTDRFSGERKKSQPEYEDISKNEEEKEKAKHHHRPNKFQEKQWEEHRKSQELRNSREHGGQVPDESSAPMQQIRPEESAEVHVPPVHDNFQSSEKQASRSNNEAPPPSEQIPYRRKNRFYRNHYYEKFLL